MENGVLEALRRAHSFAFSALKYLVRSLTGRRIRADERVSLIGVSYCRIYSDELRAIAARVKSPATREALLRVARDFDRVANEEETIVEAEMLSNKPVVDDPR
jgi:hypothetical protein